MKWLLALVAIAACAAAALSRFARIKVHRAKGGPMMRRRILGSLGVGLGSLGWAAAVAILAGLIRGGPRLDWVLLVAADVVSVFMAWTLWRADTHEKVGGDITERQREAARELARARREAMENGNRPP